MALSQSRNRIAGVFLIVAALLPLKIISNVWRVWEDWSVADWGWAINITNDLLILAALFSFIAGVVALTGRRVPARDLAIAAVILTVLYVIAYVLLTKVLLDATWFDAVKVSVRYWFIGEGYDAAGKRVFYWSSVLGGPVAWVCLGLGVWFLRKPHATALS